jgi:hypothetical protein
MPNATNLIDAKPRKPIAYDTSADQTDYRVCPKCSDKRKFSGSEFDAIYEIKPGDQGFCEECDRPLGR